MKAGHAGGAGRPPGEAGGGDAAVRGDAAAPV